MNATKPVTLLWKPYELRPFAWNGCGDDIYSMPLVGQWKRLGKLMGKEGKK